MSIDNAIVPLPYRRYELALYGLEIGDELYSDDLPISRVKSGVCVAPRQPCRDLRSLRQTHAR